MSSATSANKTSVCHEGYERTMLAPKDFSVSPLPPKGILKKPTVHFPEELCELETDSVPPCSPSLRRSVAPQSPPLETSQRLNRVPPPPLPPPPRRASPPPPPPPPPTDAPRPPSFWNPEIENDKYLNKAALALYTRFIDELSDFVTIQGVVMKKRIAVQEKRQEMKRLREEVSQSDILLIDYLRKCMANGIPSNDLTLITLFEASQAARDLVGPAEAEYEPLEVELGAGEHRLEEQYRDIEEIFESSFRLSPSSLVRQEMPTTVEYETSTASLASSNVGQASLELGDSSFLHGSLVDDRVGIGQLPIPPDYSDNEIRGSQEVQKRKPLPLSSDTPSRPSQRNSNATMDDQSRSEVPAELLGIAGAEDMDERHFTDTETRNRRISQSLKGVIVDCLADPLDSPESLPDDFPLDLGLNEGEILLLLGDDDDTRLTLSNYLMCFANTRDRVNRWMLHQLRISRRETYALRRSVMLCSPRILDWAILAMSQWSEDELAQNIGYSVDDESDDSAILEFMNPPYLQGISSSLQHRVRQKYQPAPFSTAALAPTESDLHDRSQSTRPNTETTSNVSPT
ncbi:hypothetical protein P153DRAFT_8951 [Dothidotthia symphoricarpi CBS 119687]|uniref:Uncharacterized protein n=1 Tax=Dothidotthia symphoricarpi CBS 119687 TaxID=1392245 RepID=A0A6A6ARZ0_9PLEO|nr:uncharacterized protein P153DRAFT_8951 [Dothidotthia symphoricarpi CBS 119687]KAF2134752.1 hypothetical protein P153DRAFT_8951 [Dothidotthia symphoricarpi CBS 119687]